jgi:hypothetical protein
VFGVPLDRLMKNNPREKGRTVPYLVDVCTEFLFTKCTLTPPPPPDDDHIPGRILTFRAFLSPLACAAVAVQGLFRESGSGAEIEKKKVLVDLGATRHAQHDTHTRHDTTRHAHDTTRHALTRWGGR